MKKKLWSTRTQPVTNPSRVMALRSAGFWCCAALTVALRPGWEAARDYREATNTAQGANKAQPNPMATRSADTITTAALSLAALGELGMQRYPGVLQTIRLAGLGAFALSRVANVRSLPGRWSYDTFVDAVLATHVLSHNFSGRRVSAPLQLALSRALVFLPYTQAGLSKMVHGTRAWLVLGDANEIYHQHLGGDASHPFANPRLRPFVRSLTRLIPGLELAALPVAMFLPGKLRLLAPIATTLFHLSVGKSWSIYFWQATALQWLNATTRPGYDLTTILTSLRRKS